MRQIQLKSKEMSPALGSSRLMAWRARLRFYGASPDVRRVEARAKRGVRGWHRKGLEGVEVVSTWKKGRKGKESMMI